MLSTAIELCKAALEYINSNKKTKKELKLRISVLLEEISKLIEDTALKLEKDEYPHFNCALLEKMSNHLHFHLLEYVPQEEVDELRKTLIESTQIEKEFAKRHDPKTIPSLKSAAGEFKAMSLLMKL
jgi:hypothetical protein